MSSEDQEQTRSHTHTPVSTRVCACVSAHHAAKQERHEVHGLPRPDQNNPHRHALHTHTTHNNAGVPYVCALFACCSPPQTPDTHLLEQPKQHVCVDRALVSLVQDDDAVVLKLIVQQALAQQHAVGHVLDVRRGAGAVLETDGVTDLRPGPNTQHGTARQAVSIFCRVDLSTALELGLQQRGQLHV